MNISDELERILGEMDEDERKKADESNVAKQMALLAEGGTAKSLPAGTHDMIHELRASMYGADPTNTHMPQKPDLATQFMQFLAQMYMPGLVSPQANVPTAAQGSYADVPSHASGGSIGYHQPGSLEQNMMALGGDKAIPIIMALHKASGGVVDNPSTLGSMGNVDVQAQLLTPEQSAAMDKRLADQIPTAQPFIQAPPQSKPESLTSQYDFLTQYGKNMIPNSPFMQLTEMARKPLQELMAGLGEVSDAAKIPPVMPELAAFEAAMGPGAQAAMRKSDEALKSMTPPPGTLAMTLYHGTPHTIENFKFDPEMIGSGEGNAAFLPGFYGAEAKKTAEGYQKALSGYHYSLKDLEDYFKPGSIRGSSAGYDKILDYDPQKNLVTAQQVVKDKNGNWKPDRFYGYVRQHKTAPDYLEFEKALGRKPSVGGNLYEMDLPDEHIDKMIDWDKPLRLQHPDVKKVLADKPAFKSELQNPPAPEHEQSIGVALDRANRNKHFAGDVIGKDTATPMEVSKYFSEQGIPGVKYLDRSSRAAGEGSRNFVVFPGHEDKITFLSRNGEPLHDLMTAKERDAISVEQNIHPDYIKRARKEINGEGMDDDEYYKALNERANKYRIEDALEKYGYKTHGHSNVSSSSYHQKRIENKLDPDMNDNIHQVRISDHVDRHPPSEDEISKHFNINYRSDPANWSDISIWPNMTDEEMHSRLSGLLE